VTAWRDEAATLDATDPLGWALERFAPLPPDITAYLDGNSLGRPLVTTAGALGDFATGSWGCRLIRGWTDEWLEWPERLGDRIGAAVLGAAAGQVVVGDSTSVLLYKLACGALDARPTRRRVIIGDDDFPTDRWLLEGIAAARGLQLDRLQSPHEGGVTLEQVAAAVGPDTALVLLSHVAYRSAWVADGPGITAAAHDAGALVCWDLSHSAGSVPVDLDGWGADLAVGCTYKYLSGGPGSPAFAYVGRHLQQEFRQPIWGWIGAADPFAMGPRYQPAPGVRSMLSGTPPVLAMVPLSCSLALIEEAGISAIHAKSQLLTDMAVRMADAELAPFGVEMASPRDPACRGGHVTLRRADFRAVNDRLWSRGVLPDFRTPDGIRMGLAPLSTSFTELVAAMEVLVDEARR
jgi:kynureninase